MFVFFQKCDSLFLRFNLLWDTLMCLSAYNHNFCWYVKENKFSPPSLTFRIQRVEVNRTRLADNLLFTLSAINHTPKDSRLLLSSLWDMTTEWEAVIYSSGIVSVFSLCRSPTEKPFLTSSIQAEQSGALIIQSQPLPRSSGSSVQKSVKKKKFWRLRKKVKEMD